MMAKAPDLVQIKIRMPRALLQRLTRDAARITGHSTNAEIVRRLQQSYETASLKEVSETVKATHDELAEFSKIFRENMRRAYERFRESQSDKPEATPKSGDDNDQTTRPR
jgi:CRP-like cAMP-binding protein